MLFFKMCVGSVGPSRDCTRARMLLGGNLDAFPTPLDVGAQMTLFGIPFITLPSQIQKSIESGSENIGIGWAKP